MFKDANITMIKKTGKDGKDEIDVQLKNIP